MKPLLLLFLLVVSLLLQSCTVAYFSIDNELTKPSLQYKQEHKVAYYVSVTGQPVYKTMTREYSPQKLQNMCAWYGELTQKVFDREGLVASCTTNKEEASFLIAVKATPFRSALPQEYLTGLSFGLIPSWGTRYDEYSYTFEKTGEKKAHSYYVNAKSYNHLILFPIFWVDFFTCDESRVYEKALRNYLTKE